MGGCRGRNNIPRPSHTADSDFMWHNIVPFGENQPRINHEQSEFDNGIIESIDGLHYPPPELGCPSGSICVAPRSSKRMDIATRMPETRTEPMIGKTTSIRTIPANPAKMRKIPLSSSRPMAERNRRANTSMMMLQNCASVITDEPLCDEISILVRRTTSP